MGWKSYFASFALDDKITGHEVDEKWERQYGEERIASNGEHL